MARPGQDGYDLRHALLREVIDADLLPGERARLHAALAHNLVDLLGSGELDWSGAAAEVAVHRDRTHDRPKALEWSVIAPMPAGRDPADHELGQAAGQAWARPGRAANHEGSTIHDQ
jgi:hypothetical protein